MADEVDDLILSQHGGVSDLVADGCVHFNGVMGSIMVFP